MTEHSQKLSNLARFGILLPFALAAISRGLTLFPYFPNHEALPKPFEFGEAVGSGVVISILWLSAGLLLLAGIFWGHKVTILKGKVAELRLDDVGILSVIFMNLFFGAAFYLNWIQISLSGGTSTEYLNARNFFPLAVSSFVGWYIWFSARTARRVIAQALEERALDE